MVDHYVSMEQKLHALARLKGLPESSIAALVSYIMKGQPVDGFLKAVLANDLMDAFARAGDIDGHMLLNYAEFLADDAPIGCYGSRAAYCRWVRGKGLLGEQAQREDRLAAEAAGAPAS